MSSLFTFLRWIICNALEHGLSGTCHKSMYAVSAPRSKPVATHLPARMGTHQSDRRLHLARQQTCHQRRVPASPDTQNNDPECLTYVNFIFLRCPLFHPTLPPARPYWRRPRLSRTYCQVTPNNLQTHIVLSPFPRPFQITDLILMRELCRKFPLTDYRAPALRSNP